jgi:hypothetical protein
MFGSVLHLLQPMLPENDVWRLAVVTTIPKRDDPENESSNVSEQCQILAAKAFMHSQTTNLIRRTAVKLELVEFREDVLLVVRKQPFFEGLGLAGRASQIAFHVLGVAFGKHSFS